MTAAGSVDTAVRAFKRGAVDFVTKPFDENKFFAAVDAALPARGDAAPRPLPGSSPVMVGGSPRFRETMDVVTRFARPDINILIQGETGTGKELFARKIHAASKRAAGPFVPVDCSILTETLIESELFGHEKGAFTGAHAARIGHFQRAEGGTLFLDEIGNLSLPTQAKLLRVLQERTLERVGGRETIKLDIRVVSATNVNLKEAVRAGTFRMDLFYRLGEMTISTPPLRERIEDVAPLAAYFVERYATQYELGGRGITAEALRVLEGHPWPGNVRELENAMKAAVILADDRIRPEHLAEVLSLDEPPDSLPPTSLSPTASLPPVSLPSGGERFRVEIEFGLGDSLDLKALAAVAAEKAERAVLEAVLRQARYPHAQLARLVNLDPKTLRAKLRKYGLEA
jgi:DNA-binding NtrC family response regulator